MFKNELNIRMKSNEKILTIKEGKRQTNKI